MTSAANTRAEGTYLIRRKGGQVQVAFWQPATNHWQRLGRASEAADDVQDTDVEVIGPVEEVSKPTWSFPVGEIFWHIEPLSWARRAHAALRAHARWVFARELAEENDRLRDQLGNASRGAADVALLRKRVHQETQRADTAQDAHETQRSLLAYYEATMARYRKERDEARAQLAEASAPGQQPDSKAIARAKQLRQAGAKGVRIVLHRDEQQQVIAVEVWVPAATSGSECAASFACHPILAPDGYEAALNTAAGCDTQAP